MSEPTIPSLPDGYDVTKHVTGDRSDCHVTVGFVEEDTHIPRFLVLLHYQVNTDPLRWDAIARMITTKRLHSAMTSNKKASTSTSANGLGAPCTPRSSMGRSRPTET